MRWLWAWAGGWLLACASAGSARAGAWPLPPGQTLSILKFEQEQAGKAFDPSGRIVPIPKLRQEDFSLLVEHGLTRRLTLQGELGLTEGSDQFVHYAGRGPAEIGLRYAAIVSPRTVVSLYAGAIAPGVGRNAGYAAPGQGHGDFELRLLAARSGVWRRRNLFGELQVARLFRSGLPDETRLDLTLGLYATPRWLVLWQDYAGEAEGKGVQPRWLKTEASLVRSFGRWRVQAGWRQAVWGREMPVESGPVLAIWRRF